MLRIAQRPNFFRDLFAALACYALIIAPFGCQLSTPLADVDNDDPNRNGLFISDGIVDGIILSGRSSAGEFFVFGARDGDGRISRLDSISLRASDGESVLIFEDGRPVYARGTDGSYVSILYDEISAERLAASAELYNAASGEKQTVSADIDVQATLAEVATAVRTATGRTLETTSAAETTAAATSGSEKTLTHSVRITIFDPFFSLTVLPFVAAIGAATVILGQIFVAMYIAVASLVQLAVYAAFAPLILLNEILSDVVFHIEFVPLFDLFADPPDPPAIIIF